MSAGTDTLDPAQGDPALVRAAWRGSDLASRPDWVHPLTTTERDEIVAAVAAARAAGLELDTVRHAPPALPTLAPAIARWADELRDGRGVVLLRHFPIEVLDPADVELGYVLLGAHLGTAVAQNSDGDLLGHVRDDGSDPDDPTVRRYRTRLAQPFHVDGSDVVGLLCLQPARSGGLSQIVSSVTVHHEIVRRRPDLAPLLEQPWCFDRYGQEGPGELPWFEMPILSRPRGRFQFVYLRWYIDKAQTHPEAPRLTPAQLELLDLVDALADDPELHLDMDFRPGDVQLLANRTILHSRTAYEDEDDPALRRHLLRLWLDLPRG